MESRTKHLRLRACLLTGLIATVSGCGWLGSGGEGSYAELKETQADAETELRAQGAQLESENFVIMGMGAKGWAVDLSGQEVTDDTLSLLKNLFGVMALNLSGSTITDDLLGELSTLELDQPLVRLDLSDTQITDEGLASLKNPLVLKELNLTGTSVTDGGVERFIQMREDHPRILPNDKKLEVTR